MSETDLPPAPTGDIFRGPPIRCVRLDLHDSRAQVLRRREKAADWCPVIGTDHCADAILSVRSGDAREPDRPDPTDADAPTHCACGHEFTDAASTEGLDVGLWRRSDDGSVLTLATAPIGAMWLVNWLPLDYHPPGDAYLWVRLPGADWSPDSPAANCARPEDPFLAEHHCWVRSGTAPVVTVSKNGPTCESGESVGTPIWHGLLREGWLLTKPVEPPPRHFVELMERPPLHVVVWNENVHDRREGPTRRLYPDGIHGEVASAIGGQLGEAAVNVRTATLEQPDQGLPSDVLESCDVLVWWGHVAHDKVDDDLVDRIVRRVLEDGMGLVVLHSGHFSKPFRRLLGTTCTLRWRESDDREVVWTVAPGHLVARDLPEGFVIPAQEMYGEFFDIPVPDDLVFISSFTGGEVFRSGCGFRRGKGRIFYFSPGHETYPVFHQEEVQRVIANAVVWAAAERVPAVRTDDCVHSPTGWFQAPTGHGLP